MKELTTLLKKSGCVDITTYIQSGNAVFRSSESNPAKLSKCLENVVSDKYGSKPRIFLIKSPSLEKAVESNPFPKAELKPETLHLSFLFDKPRSANLESLKKVKSASEEFFLHGNVFYLHAPNGIGRSKLAGKLEKLLGVEATGRNWNTVSKMIELAQGLRDRN